MENCKNPVMENSEKELSIKFLSDISDIASDFIQSFGIKHEQATKGLEDPILRWLDFRLRCIDPRPRRILVSDKFPKTLPDNIGKALQHIMGLISNGEDINPYQGKGLILHHDTSGKQRTERTDFLWADWLIHHLHLSDAPISEGRYFSQRADWLLFCMMGEDFVAFIDVRQHDDKYVFSNPELLEITINNWPELMKKCEFKGIAAGEPLNPKDISELRKGGVCGIVTVGGKTYAPLGMGVTTASTPVRVTKAADKLNDYIRELAHIVCDPELQFQKEILQLDVKNPAFELCITPKGMAIYENNSDRACVLPRKVDYEKTGFLAELHDLIAPAWAVDKFASDYHISH